MTHDDRSAPAPRSAPLPRAPRQTPGAEYSTYLHIDELLTLQRPLTVAAHDELLFIIVHQSYELWFKLLLHELHLAGAELAGEGVHRALQPLRRVVAIDVLLLEHLPVLETMSPEGFLDFRDPLAPASGFQSSQFREIERRSAEIYDDFCAGCRRAGLDMPADASAPGAGDVRIASLADLYLNHHLGAINTVLHDIAELLVDHDEWIARWRHHHALMAAREIGSRPGTGGSHGVAYLEGTLGNRFYPELWAVRGRL